MKSKGLVFIGLVLLVACNSKKTGSNNIDNKFSYEAFARLFSSSGLPFQISDAGVLSAGDTTVIRSVDFDKFISDSIKTKLFGKAAKVKYLALVKLKASGKTNFYIVKAISGNKKVALLIAFANGRFDAVFPLLVPDDDGTTTQISTIEKSGGISKIVTQKKRGDAVAEGRDVYQYVPQTKKFVLVLTNPLNNAAKIINPIDTLPRKSRLAGDYVKDKKNFVSVRDGRSATQIMVFIHIQTDECSGEIKTEMLMTSPTTAVYRQGGDPCGLTLHFTSNLVTVKEDGGCGSHHGLECSFDGTFHKKKQIKSKLAKKRSASK